MVLSLALVLAALGRGPAVELYKVVESVTLHAGPEVRLRVSDGGPKGRTPEGPALVFVHGLGGDLDTWRETLAKVRATRRAVAFEARGHGQSGRAKPATYSLEGWVEDLHAVVTDFKVDRFILVGHSLAGGVLQLYAQKHPERLAGLVFVDAIGDFRRAGTAEEIDAFLAEDAKLDGDRAGQARAFDALLGKKAKASTRRRTLASLAKLDPAAWVPLRKSLATFVPYAGLEASGIPLRALEAADNQAPVLFSQLVPEVKRATLPEVSHWLMLDAPQPFAAALERLVSDLK